MIKLHKQQGKRVGIYGLGITGLSVLRALEGISKETICFDDNSKNLTLVPKENIADLSDERWKNLDFIVLSPGIALTYPVPHPIVLLAKENNIEILGDIDLLYEEYPDVVYIGITGTNGKSTTCALLHNIVKNYSYGFQLGGNIGIPCLTLEPPVTQGKSGFILELSSYQLDLVKKLRLNYAAITNITPDHLDRHGSFEEYVKSKSRILEIGKESFVGIINVDDQTLRDLEFGNGILRASVTGLEIGFNSFLQGQHNEENITIAVGLAELIGASSEDIKSGIASFQGLPHRMEFLGVKKLKDHEISFYNDSKATNIESALKSISSLKNIFLLAGGVAKKGDDISRMKQYASEIKHLYLFGKDKNLFAEVLKGEIPLTIYENMEEAFCQALEDAKSLKKDCSILLAPACASTDQFKNFEERGQEFKKMFYNPKLAFILNS